MKTLLMSALLLPALAVAGPPSSTGSSELVAPGKSTLQLEATARSQVANDEMVAVLSADRTGQNVATLNDTVMAALNDAVKEAKGTPQVNVRLGSFSTNQNWENGKQSGWRVHGEVVLNSPDMKALSLLMGKLSQTLLVSGVSFRLSNKAREAEEKVLLAKAADNFRAKAGATAAAFGFAGYQVKDLSLSPSGSTQPPRPMPMMLAMKSSAATAMPAEGGDSDVSVTVSGSVTLIR